VDLELLAKDIQRLQKKMLEMIEGMKFQNENEEKVHHSTNGHNEEAVDSEDEQKDAWMSRSHSDLK